MIGASLSYMHSQAYDKLADSYAERADHSRYWMMESMGKHLLPLLKPESLCLDVGCGVGLGAELLAQNGHNAMGIDVSTRMIEVCKRDRTAGHYEVCDYMQREFSTSGFFDFILAFAFLHLWPRDHVGYVIAKLWHDLKPGGLLYTGSTIEDGFREGWETKLDYAILVDRWRTRYPEGVMLMMLQTWAKWDVVLADNRFTDDYGKTWSDILLRKPFTAYAPPSIGDA